MNKETFAAILATIKEASSMEADADMRRYRLELVTQDMVETTPPEHRITHYINLEDGLDIQPEYVRFKILNEALVSWADDIKDVFMILPYSSILGLTQVVDDNEASRFQLFVAPGLRLDML